MGGRPVLPATSDSAAPFSCRIAWGSTAASPCAYDRRRDREPAEPGLLRSANQNGVFATARAQIDLSLDDIPS